MGEGREGAGTPEGGYTEPVNRRCSRASPPSVSSLNVPDGGTSANRRIKRAKTLAEKMYNSEAFF